MKFNIEHTFNGVNLEQFASLYFDEPFNIALCERVKLERELITFEQGEKRWVRSVKVTPDRTIPSPADRILGAKKLSYIEHLDFEPEALRGTWRSESMVMTDKVSSGGTFHFAALDGERVTRVIEGEVRVKIFGFGGVVEQFIVSDIERSYKAAADFTQEWINQNFAVA